MTRYSGIRLTAIQLLTSATLLSPLAANANGIDVSGQIHDEANKAQATSNGPHDRHHMSDKKSHAPEVKHSIKIKANPEQVWEAIKHQRENEENRKLLSYDGKKATLHETFASLPIVGASTCTYVEHETQEFGRIDYSMIKSDRFHVFEGAWILTPDKDGNSTIVELSNACDPGIRVPFWQDIAKMASSKAVKRRLDAVCTYAEQLNQKASR